VEFVELNSYYRMLVHRVARYYDLQRIADSFGRKVVVFRPPIAHSRPLLKLSDFVEPVACVPPEDEEQPIAQPKFTIMKRTVTLGEIPMERSVLPQKTLEEREREYEAARARIFANIEELELSQTDEQLITTIPVVGNSEEDHAVEVENADKVYFQGWKNVDEIRPFIPARIQPIQTAGMGNFDFDSVWIPQHIFVVTRLPKEETVLKSFKGKCKRRHCRIHLPPNSSSGLLVFSYKVGISPAQLSDSLGLPCHLWRPYFYCEPPV
jgi:hypothetical protein